MSRHALILIAATMLLVVATSYVESSPREWIPPELTVADVQGVLARLPRSIDDWTTTAEHSNAVQNDSYFFASRTYENPVIGSRIIVAVAIGKPRHVSILGPYPVDDFGQTQLATSRGPVEIYTAYNSDAPSIRTSWTFWSKDGWSAPRIPRLKFGIERRLGIVYFGQYAKDNEATPPAVEFPQFLIDFWPALEAEMKRVCSLADDARK